MTLSAMPRQRLAHAHGVLLLVLTGCADNSSLTNTRIEEPSSPPPHVTAADLADVQSSVGSVVTNSLGMSFVPIPAGSFLMGTPESSPSFHDGERQHQATLTRPFHLAAFTVTQQEFEQVMGTNPSTTKSPWYPVENVSWDDAVEFCARLSELPDEKQAARRYRLPTEAEWEFACRAGTTTDFSCGDDPLALREFAWFHDNANQQTHPVGQKRPNPWSLYDMHGNVFQWCQDVCVDYPAEPVIDPVGDGPTDARVARGGSWICPSPQLVRSAFRHAFERDARTNYIGFRIVLECDDRES